MDLLTIALLTLGAGLLQKLLEEDPLKKPPRGLSSEDIDLSPDVTTTPRRSRTANRRISQRSHTANSKAIKLDGGIHWIHYYYPKRTGRLDKRSQKILEFKSGDSRAINYYFACLKAKLPQNLDGVVIAVVPSSRPSDFSGSMYQIVRKLCAFHPGLVDGSKCLVRHTAKQKAHLGGSRDKSIHFQTIRVQHPEIFYNKEVLLLDDVITTGNSMQACKELLLTAGAKQVTCLALAKTVH